MKHRLLARISIPMLVATLLFMAAAAPAPAHHNQGHGGGPGGGGDPPPPTLDGGWIYYYGSPVDDREIYRSSPDGITNDIVAGAPADYGCFVPECSGGATGVPSQDSHDGDRWYISPAFPSADVVFPSNGYYGNIVEIDAIREGSNPGTRLSDLRSACIEVVGRVLWVRDSLGNADAAITWVGAQWYNDPLLPGECETFVDVGIFRADLVYDGVTGAIVDMSAPVLAVQTPLIAGTFRPDVNGGFSWSPDGSQVAYTRENGPATGGLYVASIGDPPGSHPRIVEGTLFDVEWSPDQDAAAGMQSTIAYTGWTVQGKTKGGVWGVQPDGSGKQLLAEAKLGKNSSQTSHVHYDPSWSPAGSHLAYIDYEYGGSLGSQGIRSIRRMAADGSDNTLLHIEPDVPDIRGLLGWTDID